MGIQSLTKWIIGSPEPGSNLSETQVTFIYKKNVGTALYKQTGDVNSVDFPQ